MKINFVPNPCRYDERRIVFIMLGLSNSGKTTRTNALKSRFEGRGLKSIAVSASNFLKQEGVPSPAEVELAENWCQEKFLESLNDVSIRRIFVDNNNLVPEQRQFYIEECEKRDIEWVIVSVGRFTNDFAESCYRNNAKVDWATYRRELQSWGEYYRSVLAEIESIKAKGYEDARMMRGDTRIVATRITEQGREVVFGAKADGTYIRAFIFKDNDMGNKVYLTAINAEHGVDKEHAKMTIGRRYNGSMLQAI